VNNFTKGEERNTNFNSKSKIENRRNLIFIRAAENYLRLTIDLFTIRIVKLKLCKTCKRPFMASEEFCPHCPRPEFNSESWVSLGCLLAMILPLFLLILFWLFFFLGFIFR